MKYSISQKIVKTLAFGIVKFLYFITIEGKENLPTKPYIICANHRSYLDPVFLVTTFNEPIYFMAKSDLFKIWWLAPILRWFNAFPVRRGEADISAIKKSISILKNNNILGIFPEGKRNKTKELLLPGEKGVASLVKLTNVKVVPIAICGKILPFHKVKIKIAKPLEFSRNELDEVIVNKIMTSIQESILKELIK